MRNGRSFTTTLEFLKYRYRFLLLYTVYGVTSIGLELVIMRGLESLGVSFALSNIVGVSSGIAFAFWMNVRFNFKVPRPKRNRALMYFVTISLASWTLQYVLRLEIGLIYMSYELSRIIIAGALFLIAYWFHRRYSFNDYKQVGVAIYADGVEDIGEIYDKIGDFPDFIHIDIVDSTFKADAPDVRAYRSEVVRAYWRTKPIEAHIMSRRPSNWIAEIGQFVDRAYVHADIDEPVSEVFEWIRDVGCEPGIVVSLRDGVEEAMQLLQQVSHVLLLTISEPGSSGQALDIESLSLLKQINEHPRRNHFDVCVDGGVNQHTIGLISAERVVSGSYVLSSAEPARRVMVLQTSGSYETA